MRVLGITAAALVLLALIVVAFLYWSVGTWRGVLEGPGEITETRLPRAVVDARGRRQIEALYGPGSRLPARARPKQILFGDLHVHTTFSTDAFLRSLPLMQGEGAHPPADACDFARFCSDLDFWSINDHAVAITPQHWSDTVESIRQCNAAAGDPADPDLVSFLGWEWTHVGRSPEEHYGHKNVIFRDLEAGRVPTRPISARSSVVGRALTQGVTFRQRVLLPLAEFSNRQPYLDLFRLISEIRDTPVCPDGVDVRELPDDCSEVAPDPSVLFEKLAQWGFESIVIPHGTTWGFYTPPGSSLDKQLRGAMHDPERQTLFEIYSGHGNSEEYRDWRAVAFDAAGNAVCPEPSPGYEPCCWRAGEIIRERCGELPDDECERRVIEARANHAAAGVVAHNSVPGASAEDWKGCGQCLDCFNPSFSYRPAGSGQYALALTNFDDPEQPRRFRFGFMASSDNHSSRPGTGYKEYGRRRNTEASGPRDALWRERIRGEQQAPEARSLAIDPWGSQVSALQAVDFERQASFFMTGGLVAAHAAGRSRDAVWDALGRREVYGTSGDRILLWFDLLNGPSGPAPMGSSLSLGATPRFRVRAVGAFEQLPGCPEHSTSALSPERMRHLCQDECYHPGERRRSITRIEVVRIRPQSRPDEPIAELVEDPWRRFRCAPDAAGCTVQFDDPEFSQAGREFVYYARAVQEPTPAVNAANLRCSFDDEGRCIAVDLCHGDYRTEFEDDCLAPNEERAWSSPIYLTPSASR